MTRTHGLGPLLLVRPGSYRHRLWRFIPAEEAEGTYRYPSLPDEKSGLSIVGGAFSDS